MHHGAGRIAALAAQHAAAAAGAGLAALAGAPSPAAAAAAAAPGPGPGPGTTSGAAAGGGVAVAAARQALAAALRAGRVATLAAEAARAFPATATDMPPTTDSKVGGRVGLEGLDEQVWYMRCPAGCWAPCCMLCVLFLCVVSQAAVCGHAPPKPALIFARHTHAPCKRPQGAEWHCSPTVEQVATTVMSTLRAVANQATAASKDTVKLTNELTSRLVKAGKGELG
jgi:hypothetical protein